MPQDSDFSRNPDYHAARAAEEQQLADGAADANARASHLEMADRHAKLAETAAPKPQQAAAEQPSAG
jgi:hypothetical protein